MVVARWPPVARKGRQPRFVGVGLRVVCTGQIGKFSLLRKKRDARFSKFSNFAVRPTSAKTAKWLFEAHESSKSHRRACGSKEPRRRVDSEPDLPDEVHEPLQPEPFADDLLSGASSAQTGDAELLHGNVPTAADWKDAWALLTERVALRREARICSKKQSLSDRLQNRRRKRHREQLRVMAECVRQKNRKQLSQATSISLAMDESKYRKIIRFRADLPTRLSTRSHWRESNLGAAGFCVTGVLGILDCSKKHASDFEEDHAVTAVKLLGEFLTKFFTPLGRGRRQAEPLACDEGLKDHVLRTVTSVSADGCAAERRAVFLAAREIFPNLLIVIRDSAHAIRIASKALHSDDVFGKVWRELFNARHALVPDLMHSPKWHNLLNSIQEDNFRVVAMHADSQPLARVVRNLAFAKQRFDSTAEPVMKIALMLLPCATLLAYVASDKRHDREMRERATTLLNMLDSKFCTAIGVSADWGIICQWFLSLFDVASHDIAKSRCQIDSMIETLDAVFLEGRVFQNLLDGASGARNRRRAAADLEGDLPPAHVIIDAGTEVGFITEKVMHNLRHKYVFYAGGESVMLWGEPAQDDKVDLLNRLQNVAALTKERLQADFPPNDVRSALSIFDKRLVLKAFGPQPCADTKRRMLRRVAQLATVVGCDAATTVLQYNSVLPYILQQVTPAEPLAGNDKSNQAVWGELLDSGVWEKACPHRLQAAARAIRKLIRFYISIEDGECTVERDLGEFRSQMKEYCCGDMLFHDDCLVLRLNGPKSTEDFDAEVAGSRAMLTSFSKDCASLWPQLFGRRFGHYNPHATIAAKLKRQAAKKTVRGAARGALAAARIAVASKRNCSGATGAPLHEGAGTRRSALWNDDMEHFHKRSRKNIPGTTQARAGPGCPFVNPVGVHLNRQAALPEAPQERHHSYTQIASVGACTVEPLASGSFAEVNTGLHRCALAGLVIVQDLSLLHDVAKVAVDIDLAVSLFYIVIYGKDVITEAQFEAVHRDPRRVHPQQVTRHVPALQNSEVKFALARRIVVEYIDVRRALQRAQHRYGSSITFASEDRASGGNPAVAASSDTYKL